MCEMSLLFTGQVKSVMRKKVFRDNEVSLNAIGCKRQHER